MRLIPSENKAQIKWFYYSGGQKYRYSKGLLNINAWDVTCSCGWETKTGGGVRSWLDSEVFKHKFFDHGYRYSFEKGN